MRLVTLLGIFSIVLAAAERPLEFNRDVRPILADKCFLCHGPDAKNKNIPLRLDSEAAAKADLGKDVHAIVDGQPAASELIRRITSDNKGMKMPPVYSGLKLTEKEQDTLWNWIEQGAKWEKHWSFIPPKRWPEPQVKTVAWPKNSIDYFVLERLEREGLKPSPEASRETLIRRVSLDLTGLPATPAEIDAFMSDQSANAYEKVVDRLLASPRYGERMAERWLDGARYADTNGYQYDAERVMWPWRDWVIAAFNRNERFNQFTLEQIAGDMLPNATLQQKIATGFNRNHRANTEDGLIAEEYAVEYVVDRVETTSAVFLGLTLGCARCHNHKYDPFTQKEFYQTFAYFNNVPELGRAMKYGNSPPLIPAPTREEQTALNGLETRMRLEEEFLQQHGPAAHREQKAWEQKIAKGDPVYWAPDVAQIYGLSTAAVNLPRVEGRTGRAIAFDGKSEIDAGDVAPFDIEDRFTLSTWIYSESTPDGSLISRMKDDPKGKGYGLHLDQGKVHVNLTSVWVSDAIRVETEETLEPKHWYNITVTYSGSRTADGVHVYIDGKQAKVKVLLDNLYRPFRNAGNEVKDPFRIAGGWGPERRFRGLIDDARVYTRVLSEREIAVLALGESLNDIARKPEAQQSGLEKDELRWYFLENVATPELQDAWKRLLALGQEKEKLEGSFPTVMVMAESPTPKETRLLTRGAYDHPAEKVEPGVPAVLPPLPAGVPDNRLGFAEWLIDPGNPLLARVTMNRFWQMYFGTGIVKTIEDFGTQGEWPSHPELLDWLATEFVRTGWDMKAMQKLIVMSATYRQSSKTAPELEQRDPDNRLLARGPRFRLPAEMIRDQALAVSGLLYEKLGGPSVKPYQPAGLWKEITMQGMDYTPSQGHDLYRRSLYTFWKRTVAPPMMVNFDAANRETCVVRETRTNTPLQALDLMNDLTFVEAARFLGQRMIKEGGADADSRLRYGFLLATGRKPSPSEAQILRGNLQYHLDYFAGKPDELKAYLNQGASQPDPAIDARQLAAYASVGSLLLNLDETISKE